MTQDNKSRACSIEGCNKTAFRRGWCSAHYERFLRHGDPLGGGTYNGAPFAFLENTVLSFEGDECLIWPFSTGRAGYGRIWHGGKMRDLHRVVCEMEHGPPPTSKHYAAHSCGKGHEGCCNRKHLEWKTPKENQADRIVHGTSNRGERCGRAKLTEAQVLEIRSSAKSKRQLAQEIGVSKSLITAVKVRRAWAWLEDAS